MLTEGRFPEHAAVISFYSPERTKSGDYAPVDYRNRAEIFALLHQLNREEEKTILFITHEINEAVQNANRILTLKSGKLLFDGTTADFLASDWLETTFETSFLRIPHPELPFPAVLPIKQSNEMP